MNETEVKQIAVEAAEEAIRRLRKTQKLGRGDESGGDTKIGSMLKVFREEKGLSIVDLGKDTGLHPTTIGKIEAGQRGMGLKTFSRLAYHLDTRFADWVIEWLGS